MYHYQDAEKTTIVRISDGALIPAVAGNRFYAEVLEWVAKGNAVTPYSPPPITANDVRAEAQRRIIALVGAPDLTSCLVKQLNANMRANELNDIQHTRALTAEEAAEANALRSLATQIKSIRAASNVLEPNPPPDYTDDKYWP